MISHRPGSGARAEATRVAACDPSSAADSPSGSRRSWRRCRRTAPRVPPRGGASRHPPGRTRSADDRPTGRAHRGPGGVPPRGARTGRGHRSRPGPAARHPGSGALPVRAAIASARGADSRPHAGRDAGRCRSGAPSCCCLGLWALLRSPDGSTVIVRVSPAEGTIVTLGGDRSRAAGPSASHPASTSWWPWPRATCATASASRCSRTPRRRCTPSSWRGRRRAALRRPRARRRPSCRGTSGKEFTATFESGVQGVEIFVEGESIGRTPEAGTTLSAGPGLQLRGPGRGIPERAEGTFGSYGDPAVTVELALERLPETRKPRQTKPARGVGHLVCTSTPQGAEIFIDGKPTGRRTPVPATDPIELPEGRHRVLFEIAGVVSEVKTITVESWQDRQSPGRRRGSRPRAVAPAQGPRPPPDPDPPPPRRPEDARVRSLEATRRYAPATA